LSIQPGLCGSNDIHVGRKIATFQLFFQSREQVVVRRGPDLENMVGDQDTGRPGRPVSSGLQCPVSRGIVVQEEHPLGEIPAEFSFQNVLQLHQQMSNTRR